ncbi:zinc-binding dehydrogenase [Tothia fuscella]|uniref:Zinc-binding dehydrogenase n=1 Tax=Tothia fuscella TaxID=1048955 RepID=A0A9P4P3A8_9PEZI|nr:zinc-binding dehydrogenase [Tothia fuscella]
MSPSKTHKAVATFGPRKPLQLIDVPTVKPPGKEVCIKVAWTASTPLDLHQADGGLLVNPPQVLGDGASGIVVEVGDAVERLKVGDEVFGFTWRSQQDKAHQEYITAPENLFGLIPKRMAAEAVVTVPNNLVCVCHTLTHDLHLLFPWPLPENYVPEEFEVPILIWGGSSSVGQYALQVLKYLGYKNLITTASPKHHQMLKDYGARITVDYNSVDVVDQILKLAGGKVKYAIDCIASREGSLEPISKILEAGSIVAVSLPVIIRDATDTVLPEYSMEPDKAVKWADGVEVVGTRTHFYLENKFFEEHLQAEIIPLLLASGDVVPNRQRIVNGETLLERAENALDLLRRKVPSGERLVWRVAEP